ncbi:MAG TPA: TMEM175 family protein [Gemmatimonadales bacterium]|nr:TMEM175 family protein [Gemmatimonadales bacterium]
MHKGRLEAFSDGVLAIIITVMLLELHVPAGGRPADLSAAVPKLMLYALSFVFLGIYWVNHHHLFQATQRVTGVVLWANLHLLFWLSLIPFVTNWMGEHFDALPVAAYGAVLFVSGVAYNILARALVSAHGADSVLAKAIGSDVKGVASVIIYGVGIAVAAFRPTVAFCLYVVVALIWFVPDRRIESLLH